MMPPDGWCACWPTSGPSTASALVWTGCPPHGTDWTRPGSRCPRELTRPADSSSATWTSAGRLSTSTTGSRRPIRHGLRRWPRGSCCPVETSFSRPAWPGRRGHLFATRRKAMCAGIRWCSGRGPSRRKAHGWPCRTPWLSSCWTAKCRRRGSRMAGKCPCPCRLAESRPSRRVANNWPCSTARGCVSMPCRIFPRGAVPANCPRAWARWRCSMTAPWRRRRMARSGFGRRAGYVWIFPLR